MKNHNAIKTLLLVLVLGALALSARVAFAGGFLIYDLSGEAIGRGSAVTAGVDEPAAVWFNPAALPYMKGVGASVGGVAITARSSFSPAGGGPETQSERGNFFLPTIFANAALTDRLAVGMGVFTAFGIGISWPNDWVGRESAIAASLQTLDFNPTVAFKVLPQLSVAAGFNAIRGIVDFKNGLPAVVGGDVRLVGGTWGYGYNVALLYRPMPDRLHVAATYRSRAKLDFAGQADFSPGNPDFSPTLRDQPGTASITLPDILTVGVMGRPRPDLALSFDANVIFWSTYSRIDIKFQDPNVPSRAIQPEGQNTFTLRAGADWKSRWPGINLRAGLIYDHAAIPTTGLGPGLPDSSRVDGTVGIGYGRGHLKVDLGYMLVYFIPADATSGREGPEGTYRTLAHLVGLTLRATWP